MIKEELEKPTRKNFYPTVLHYLDPFLTSRIPCNSYMRACHGIVRQTCLAFDDEMRFIDVVNF
ncbi:hypothetical protein TSUD_127170 [Trifolium subterraneum]|nr:hypothetical protein TSUD_127170 [Trifolium subterraneum]